jgi:hypothetical protein
MVEAENFSDHPRKGQKSKTSYGKTIMKLRIPTIFTRGRSNTAVYTRFFAKINVLDPALLP